MIEVVGVEYNSNYPDFECMSCVGMWYVSVVVWF